MVPIFFFFCWRRGSFAIFRTAVWLGDIPESLSQMNEQFSLLTFFVLFQCRSITGQCGNLCVTLSLYSFKLNLKFKYYHMPDYTEHVFTLPGITLFALAMATWIIGWLD